MKYTGVIHADSTNERRELISNKITSIVEKVMSNIPFDAAADQMMLGFLRSRLPPCLTDEERAMSFNADSVNENNQLGLNAKVRLVRNHIACMTIEDDAAAVYHCMNNTRHAPIEGVDEVEDCLPFAIDYAEGIEMILKSYPKVIQVKDIPLDVSY